MTAREKWLKARNKGIDGSDAACILGLNPWKRRFEMLKVTELRTNIGDKPAVQYGKAAEAALRDLFALDFPQYAVTYDEYGMIANRPEEPWLFATLDGELDNIRMERYDDSRMHLGVLEIKTTEIRKPSQWAEWNGGVPPAYYCQLLHQLLATGYYFAILKAQIRHREYTATTPDALKITTRHYYITIADPGVAADMAHLLKAERAFWDCVLHDKRPALILPEV